MVKFGWIAGYRDKGRQLEEVLRFFGVASPASWSALWNAYSPAFRRSPSFSSESGAIAAWLRKGEIDASNQQCQEFSASAFKQVLARARSLTRDLPRDFCSVLQDECCASGVSVVFVPELPGTRVWGATRWLSAGRALIQLSLRYKTDDHLWFTFFHEAGHILLHGRRDLFLEDDRKKDEREAEANAFAREWLIPEARYRTFRRRGSYSCAAASRFAHELGIAPGIVVGRLQHDELIERFECNELKKHLDWAFDTPQEQE